MIVLFLTMFIVMMGFGVIMPILPFYAENMGATATHLGFLFASYSVVQFIFAPIWGRMSDRYGRRPILLIGLTGFGVSFGLFGLATSLWMLFVARILGGVLSAATLPTVLAYVADTTDEKSRGGGMGVIGASTGLGVIFGPVIGGYLGAIDPSLPFFFAAALAFGISALAFLMLPESRSKEAQLRARALAQESWDPGRIWRDLFDLNWRWLLGPISQALSGPIGFILILAFLASFASANLEGTFALFTESSLGFGAAEMGTLFAIMGVVMALTQAFMVGPFINRWGEERMIQIGLISSAIGFVLILFAFNMFTMALVLGVMGVGNAAMRPAINSLASKLVPADEQGSAMGIVSSYNSLGRIFGPVVGGMLFDFLGFRSPYLFGALLFLLIYLLSVVLFRRRAQGAQAELYLDASPEPN
jgi:DHA1 family multidrug resistance protein-like MFS transporter